MNWTLKNCELLISRIKANLPTKNSLFNTSDLNESVKNKLNEMCMNWTLKNCDGLYCGLILEWLQSIWRRHEDFATSIFQPYCQRLLEIWWK